MIWDNCMLLILGALSCCWRSLLNSSSSNSLTLFKVGSLQSYGLTTSGRDYAQGLRLQGQWSTNFVGRLWLLWIVTVHLSNTKVFGDDSTISSSLVTEHTPNTFSEVSTLNILFSVHNTNGWYRSELRLLTGTPPSAPRANKVVSKPYIPCEPQVL